MTTLAVLQPSYLPWLGFFDQVRRCDYFVIYDDVQYDKNGWRNRNRIKSATGPVWLTVPVRTRGRLRQQINEVEIVNTASWARKHVRTIAEAYARAPYCSTYLPLLAELLERKWQRLVDLDIALIALMCDWFGLDVPMVRASDLTIPGDRNGRLLAFCRHFGANIYLSGDAAQAYLDVDQFAACGIQVEWQNFRHPQYPQQHGPFLSHLSALDLVLNVGGESQAMLAAGVPTASPVRRDDLEN